MDREQAAKLRRRSDALRAKAADASTTAPEREALISKANELETRVKQEYGGGAFAFTTPPYVHGARQPRPPAHDAADIGDMIRDWHESRDYFANLYFSTTDSEEDIVEEDYRYDTDEGDY